MVKDKSKVTQNEKTNKNSSYLLFPEAGIFTPIDTADIEPSSSSEHGTTEHEENLPD